MKVGDRFYIYVLNQVLAYEVDEINTVLPDELQELQTVEGRDLVTLVTCTPYGVNTHRLLVRGTRVPYVPEEADALQPTVGLVSVFGFDVRLQYLGAAIGAALLVIILVVVVLIRLKRRKGGKKGGRHAE